jgi:hypothetical protein
MKKKAKLVLLFVLFSVLSCKTNKHKESNLSERDVVQIESLSGADSSGYLSCFRILDSAANANPKDTFYNCCYDYVDFLETKTRIIANVDGDYVGPTGFTKNDLRKWHEWYDKKYRMSKL